MIIQTSQEVFDKMNISKNIPKLQTVTETKLLCKKHMRYYDQDLVQSPITGAWLRCVGCPTCYQEQRSQEATRHVERLNGNKPIFDIVNSKNAEYRDECASKVKKVKIL